MSQPNDHYFHLGKEARKNGNRCVLTDARVSPQNRSLFYQGWNHQDALMKPPPSQAEIDDTADFLKGLKQAVKEGTL